jgi:hypothetical protein
MNSDDVSSLSVMFLGKFLGIAFHWRYEVLDVNISGGHGGNVAHFSQ